MKFIVTTENKTNDKFGFQTHSYMPNFYDYILGKVKSLEEQLYISYIPERISYIVTTEPKKFLETYEAIYTKSTRLNNMMKKRKNFMSRIYHRYSLNEFLKMYKEFKEEHPNFSKNRKQFYKKPFPLDKKKDKFINGKWVKQYRLIVEPKEQLKRLQELAYMAIIKSFGYKPNNNTHSYTEARSNLTNAEPHKASNHVLKIDLKKFFPSINEDFLRTRLHSLKEFAILQIDTTLLTLNSDTQPFKEGLRRQNIVKEFVEAVIDIAILNDELPQGSPLSPVLSNIVMAEYDVLIETYCNSKQASKNKIMYTRYADDLTFSSFKPITINAMLDSLKDIFKDTPLKIHPDKIKYMKNTQRLYITGVKLNKDHKLTYGHEKKEILKREIFQALMAVKKGIADVKENQELLGRINYAKQIEPNYINNLISKYCHKFHINSRDFHKILMLQKEIKKGESIKNMQDKVEEMLKRRTSTGNSTEYYTYSTSTTGTTAI